MAYRDVEALLARLAQLESEGAAARARANRIRGRRNAIRARWFVRGVLLLAIPPFLFGALVLVFSCTCSYYPHSQRRQAENDVRTILPIAEKWRADHGAGWCPTPERLKSDKEISAGSKLTDPWECHYEIWCEGDQVRVASAGADGLFGTADDIIASDPPS